MVKTIIGWYEKVKEYYRKKDEQEFHNKMSVLYADELKEEPYPHDWHSVMLNHEKGRAIYLCRNCNTQHSIKPHSLFDREQHYELLNKQVGPCKGLDYYEPELGGEG